MTNKAHSTLTGSDLHEPKGVASATAGQVYVSDGSGSGAWTDTGATIGSASFTTGDLKPTIKTSADSGWVMCDDGTIGNLSSGATTLASSSTSALFTLLWTNFANTECAVSSGRGASAAADYAANKTIALPKMLGRVYGIAGAGSGLTSRAIGKTVGEETHQLITAELPSHTHNNFLSFPNTFYGGNNTALTSFTGSGAQTPFTSIINSGVYLTLTNASAGSDTAHNNMQPTVFLKMMMKL